MNASTIRSVLVSAGIEDIQETADGFAARCPLHEDRHRSKGRTFAINVQNGLWQCFSGTCEKRGNLFMLLHKVCGMDYQEAIEFVQSVPEEATIDLAGEGWQMPGYDDRGKVTNAKLEFLPEATLGLYDRCPTYMVHERHYEKSFLRQYDVGWDKDARRVTFAVRDPLGRLIGFTRRAVEDGQDPKYLHNFPRSETLYLLHLVAKGSPVFVGEGNPDALKPRFLMRALRHINFKFDETRADVFSALENSTATLGGGIVIRQAEILSRFRPKAVFLGFDNDGGYDDHPGPSCLCAGCKATKRSIENLRKVGLHRNVFVTEFSSHDPGDLDLLSLCGITYVSDFEWMTRKR